MTSPALNPKQQRFVSEFVIDLNATRAATRAGYSPRTANEQGARLLAKASVAAAVKERQENINAALGVDAAYVIRGLKNNAERAAQAQPVLTKDGEPTGEYRYDGATVNRSLELLGKHLGMFVDRSEITGPGGGPLQHDVRAVIEFTDAELAAIIVGEDV